MPAVAGGAGLSLVPAVERLGDAPAALVDGEWRAWSRCRADAERVAATLYHRAGIRRGDVVVAQLPNSWELIVLHVATARLGAVLLPVPMACGAHEISALLATGPAGLLVLGGSHRGRSRGDLIAALRAEPVRLWVHGGEPAEPGAAAARAVPADYAAVLAERVPPAPPHVADPADPLLLLASSGTTSRRQKVCVHSHAGLLGNAATVIADGEFTGADVIVSASQFSHAFGILSVHMAALAGARMGLLNSWEPAAFRQVLTEAGASTVFAVPAQLRDLLRLVAADGVRPPRLRQIRTGGAAVPADLVRALRRELGVQVTVQWGMTELGAGTYTRPGEPADAATIGRPLTGGQARVLDATGEPAGPGQIGELQFRGPHLFDGYRNDPALTAAAFTADGWFRTGDLACRNADDSLTYHGRLDDVINRGGLKFTGAEVEELLADLPGIRQLAILAVPDERLGQRACLVVSLAEGAALALPDVVEHLRARNLATYKLPEELVVLDALPVTPSGKVARARLRTAVAAPGTPDGAVAPAAGGPR